MYSKWAEIVLRKKGPPKEECCRFFSGVLKKPTFEPSLSRLLRY